MTHEILVALSKLVGDLTILTDILTDRSIEQGNRIRILEVALGINV